jgi:hypothetical protein
MRRLTPDLAAELAAIALGHLEREYPNALQHVLAGPEDALPPRALHPLFFGSFDWHSSVHAHWLLARLLRRYPDAPWSATVRRLFDDHFTAANGAAEAAYFARPTGAGFERPYGWAWLMMLAAELQTAGFAHWSAALAPLAEALAARLEGFLARSDYPVRSGAHGNSAFALILGLEYARQASRPSLARAIEEKARRWFGRDRDCQAWEPGGDDFVSPALTEAELMRRVLPPAAFARWLAGFLPDLARGRPRALFAPARVSDRADGKIAHLDGLNLSRAWCWRGLAQQADAALAARMRRAGERHLAISLPFVAGHYAGEHWLATFALLALEA